MRKRRKWWIQSIHDLPSDSFIQLKNQDGIIGETWLSRELVTLLEKTGEKGRLKRALKCGREGNCSNLRIKPGRVMVGVACSGYTIREVTISFKEFTPEIWEQIIEIIASDATLTGFVLSGEFPRYLIESLKIGTFSLIPESFTEMNIYCNCGDDYKPCIHGAVSWYLLAEALDKNPWHLCTIRGLCREEIIRRVSALTNIRKTPNREIVLNSTIEGNPDTILIPTLIKPDGFFSIKGEIGDFPDLVIDNTVLNPISLLGPSPLQIRWKKSRRPYYVALSKYQKVC